MNSKLFLAALALPLVFTACSQDEYFEDSSMTDANGNGMKLAFDFVKDVDVESRASWNDALSFSSTDDKFSLYWLGADITDDAYNDAEGPVALVGQSNAVFKSKDANGTGFTSESLVYEGANVAVYPANLAHYTAEAITISIDEVQDAGTVLEVPYISNKVALVRSGASNPTTNQVPGYNKGVKVSVKQAANVFDMTLNLKNHTALVGAPFNLDIEKVELVADANAFATEANLVEGAANPTDEGEEEYVDEGGKEQVYKSITQVIDVDATAASTILTSKAIVKNQDGSYTVRFVVLPTETKGLTNSSEIKVYTNCGTVTLTTDGSLIKNGSESEEAYATRIAGYDYFTKKDGTKLAIAEVFEDILNNAVKTTITSPFLNEKVGRVIKRSISVNMADADLSSCDVDSEAKIMHYIDLYKAIGKKGDMQLNLKMAEGETDNIFDITKATVDAVDDLHEAAQRQTPDAAEITLNPSSLSIQLTEGGEVYDIVQLENSVPFILAAAKDWTINDATNVVKASKIINKGTLTIKGTVNATSGNQETVAETYENEGTLKIGGNDQLEWGTVLVNSGAIKIAEDQVLNFAQGSSNTDATTLAGTIEVKGQLLTGVKIDLSATIDNYGIIGGSKDGAFKNNASITVKKEGAYTLVNDNTGSLTPTGGTAVPATINLLTKQDEVVTGEGKEGRIVYNWATADGTTFTKAANDKFTRVVFTQSTVDIVTKGSESTADVTLVFNANCELKTSDATDVNTAEEIAGIVINSGKTVTMGSSAYLKVAEEFINNGRMVLSGNLYFKTGKGISLEGNVTTITGSFVGTY